MPKNLYKNVYHFLLLGYGYMKYNLELCTHNDTRLQRGAEGQKAVMNTLGLIELRKLECHLHAGDIWLTVSRLERQKKPVTG